MKILIPNATGPDNMGDQAILYGLLPCLLEAFPGSEFTILTSEPDRYERDSHIKLDYNLYMWSAFENRNFSTRLRRVLTLFFLYFANKWGLEILKKNKLQVLINNYKSSDLIVFAGGGYLRSNKGFTQSLNLLMHLLMIRFAKLSKAKTVMAPISFGPFSYKWQEKLTAKILEGMSAVLVREKISKEILLRYPRVKVIESTDAAFFLRPVAKKTKSPDEVVVGFTLRRVLKNKSELELERAYVFALEKFAIKYGAKIQPIIQVDASKFGENDREATNSIVQELKAKELKVLDTKSFSRVAEGLGIYENLDLLLGMRMHSNIYSFIENVPFVAVSYEHKTPGICQDLGLDDYCISWENVSGEKLFDMMSAVYNDKNNLEQRKKVLNTISGYRQSFIEILKRSFDID